MFSYRNSNITPINTADVTLLALISMEMTHTLGMCLNEQDRETDQHPGQFPFRRLGSTRRPLIHDMGKDWE